MAGRVAKRLNGPAQLTNAAVTRYTGPANRRGIIRHIHVSNPSGLAVLFTMSIGADAAATRIFDAFSIAAGTVLDHYCYYIIEATEIVQAFAGTTLVLVLTIDGDEEVLL
jgi:hypothetical protein